MLHTLWPRRPDRTDVICEFFFEPATIAARRLRPLRRGRLLGQGQPRGLARLRTGAEGRAPRGATSPGRYSAEEHDVHAFDAMVAARYMEAPARGGWSHERDRRQARRGRPAGAALASSPRRDWDAIVVGGGHNGLTAAAYLARAGRSVLVLERRERLGGACTLERPFADERFVVSPCAYVVGLLDELVMRRARPARPRPALLRRRPEPLGPVRRRHLLRPVARRRQDPGRPRGDGPLEEATSTATGPTSSSSTTSAASCCAPAPATPGSATRPTRAEIEEMLGGEQEMIDLLFEASIADVLDEYLDDQRLKDALFGQGVIGTWGGPARPRHRLDQTDALPGGLRGTGPGLGLRRGRHGDDQLRDRRRRPGGRRGPRLRRAGRPRSSPARASGPRTGRRSAPPTVLCNADPKVALRLLGDAEIDAGFRERLEAWKVRSPVVKFNASLSRLPNWTAAPGEDWPARATIDVTGGIEACPARLRSVRRRRARGRLRRDLHPDRLRPDPGARRAST